MPHAIDRLHERCLVQSKSDTAGKEKLTWSNFEWVLKILWQFMAHLQPRVSWRFTLPSFKFLHAFVHFQRDGLAVHPHSLTCHI